MISLISTSYSGKYEKNTEVISVTDTYKCFEDELSLVISTIKGKAQAENVVVDISQTKISSKIIQVSGTYQKSSSKTGSSLPIYTTISESEGKRTYSQEYFTSVEPSAMISGVPKVAFGLKRKSVSMSSPDAGGWYRLTSTYSEDVNSDNEVTFSPEGKPDGELSPTISSKLTKTIIPASKVIEKLFPDETVLAGIRKFLNSQNQIRYEEEEWKYIRTIGADSSTAIPELSGVKPEDFNKYKSCCDYSAETHSFVVSVPKETTGKRSAGKEIFDSMASLLGTEVTEIPNTSISFDIEGIKKNAKKKLLSSSSYQDGEVEKAAAEILDAMSQKFICTGITATSEGGTRKVRVKDKDGNISSQNVSYWRYDTVWELTLEYKA